MDEDGANAHVLAYSPQCRLHGLAGPQDGHAGDLGDEVELVRPCLPSFHLSPTAGQAPGYLLPRIALAGIVLTLWSLHHAVLCRAGWGHEGEEPLLPLPATQPPPAPSSDLERQEGEGVLDKQPHQPLRVEDELIAAGFPVSVGGGYSPG